MSTIRVSKDKNYSVINNTVLNDTRLSWKAKGIAAYLLSKPDDWKIIREHLKNQSDDGETSVRTGLQELEAFGYLVRTRHQNELGHFDWESVLREVPVCKPSVEKPPMVYKPVDNQVLPSTDTVSTKKPSTDTVSTKKPTNQPVVSSLIGDKRLVGLASQQLGQVEGFLPAEELERTDTPTAQATAVASPPSGGPPGDAEIERSVALLTDVGMSRSNAARFAEQHSFPWLLAQVADWWEDNQGGKVDGVGALYNRINKGWSILGMSDDFLRSDLYARHFAAAPPGELIAPLETYAFEGVIE